MIRKMTHPILIVAALNLVAYAELPLSLDEVLFKLTSGTNYTAWMTYNGEIVFCKPFSIFSTGRFESYPSTHDLPSLHHTITMEQKFYNTTNTSGIIQSIKQVENILQRYFNREFSCKRTLNSIYQSICIDIDGRGWTASFCVEQSQDGNSRSSYVAKALFHNPLHMTGRFVSCEDFNLSDRGTTNFYYESEAGLGFPIGGGSISRFIAYSPSVPMIRKVLVLSGMFVVLGAIVAGLVQKLRDKTQCCIASDKIALRCLLVAQFLIPFSCFMLASQTQCDILCFQSSAALLLLVTGSIVAVRSRMYRYIIYHLLVFILVGGLVPPS